MMDRLTIFMMAVFLLFAGVVTGAILADLQDVAITTAQPSIVILGEYQEVTISDRTQYVMDYMLGDTMQSVWSFDRATLDRIVAKWKDQGRIATNP